eukprot:3539043-Prymnesium_polylepis.1
MPWVPPMCVRMLVSVHCMSVWVWGSSPRSAWVEAVPQSAENTSSTPPAHVATFVRNARCH